MTAVYSLASCVGQNRPNNIMRTKTLCKWSHEASRLDSTLPLVQKWFHTIFKWFFSPKRVGAVLNGLTKSRLKRRKGVASYCPP